MKLDLVVNRPSTCPLLRVVVLLAWLLLAPLAFAQGTVSSGLNGLVRDQAGRPAGGVTVTAVHEPTGTTYSATSSSAGRFSFGGMIVGGPYTVTARGTGGAGASQN
jgi:hypothetical protein